MLSKLYPSAGAARPDVAAGVAPAPVDAVAASQEASKPVQHATEDPYLEPGTEAWRGPSRCAWSVPRPLVRLASSVRVRKPPKRKGEAVEGGPSPLEPVPDPVGARGDSGTVIMPVWGRAPQWPAEGALKKVLVDTQVSWKADGLKSDERQARQQAHSRAGAAPQGPYEAPPNPGEPARGASDVPSATTSEQSVAVASEQSVAVGGGGSASRKRIRLADWRPPPRLVLPDGVAYDPVRYSGTERAARAQLRAGVLPHAAQAATGGAQPSPGAPLKARSSAAPPATPAAKASTGPPSGDYTAKLVSLMEKLQSDQTPPSTAVRAFWVQLSPPEQARFGADFPQFMHYIAAEGPAGRRPDRPGTAPMGR